MAIALGKLIEVVMGNMDNFYIVGAAKSGTTSLYHHLDRHPDVHMSPIKEPHYFCKDIRYENFDKKYQEEVRFDAKKYLKRKVLEKKHIAYIDNFDEYSQLFRERGKEKICGEISTGYLYSKVAAEEIYRFDSNAKIAMVLRDPIERAFSHWMMDLRSNDVCRNSFHEAILKDQENTDGIWGKNHLYIEIGLYHKQVERYFNVFPKEQVLVLLYDDLKSDPVAFFKKLFEFLEIENLPIDVDERFNFASLPRYPALDTMIKKARLDRLAAKYFPVSVKKKIKNVLFNKDDLPKLTSRDRGNVISYFEADIILLEELLGRDLSAWRLAE